MVKGAAKTWAAKRSYLQLVCDLGGAPLHGKKPDLTAEERQSEMADGRALTELELHRGKKMLGTPYSVEKLAKAQSDLAEIHRIDQLPASEKAAEIAKMLDSKLDEVGASLESLHLKTDTLLLRSASASGSAEPADLDAAPSTAHNHVVASVLAVPSTGHVVDAAPGCSGYLGKVAREPTYELQGMVGNLSS